MDITGIGDTLVNLYKFAKEDKETRAWLNLTYSLFLSGFIALTGTSGGCLVAGKAVAFSIGSGLLACSVATLTVVLRDPLARNLLLAVPQELIAEYQKSGDTVIEPAVKK